MPVTTRRATKYPNCQQTESLANIRSKDITPNRNLRGVKKGRNVVKERRGKRSSSKSLVSITSSKRDGRITSRRRDLKQIDGEILGKRVMMNWINRKDGIGHLSQLLNLMMRVLLPTPVNGVSEDNMSTVSDVDSATQELTEATCSQTPPDMFCPWLEFPPERIPALELPGASMDLLIDSDHILHTLEVIYLSKLLGEIHIAFLRLFFSEEEQEKTTFSVFDTNLSFNVVLQLLDHMNYAEVLRLYLESDPNFPAEVLKILEEGKYPFVAMDKRLVVLKWMCDRFFETTIFKQLVRDEGKIKHDQHCRYCAKSCIGSHESQQTSIECSGCDAIYHFNCTESSFGPPELNEKWLCSVCIKHQLTGSTDCILPGQTTLRKLPLGYDRKGRIYWFLVRRVFIHDPFINEIYYYSTLPQLFDLCAVLDPNYYEKRLCQTLCECLPHIAVQMHITLELTEERRRLLQTKSPKPVVDNSHRMAKILTEAQIEADNKSEQITDNNVDSVEKPSIMQIIRNLLCIRHGRLEACYWSGKLNEDQLIFNHKVWNDSLQSNNYGSFYSLSSDLELRMRRGIRLGFSDAGHRNYVNQFSVNDLARSPYLRAKERDKKRYLNSRFCLTDDGEFNWPNHRGASPFGTEADVLKCIQLSIRRMIERIPDTLMHQNWILENEKERFMQQLLREGANFNTLRYLLLLFERVVRKPVFLNIWWAGLALTRFNRVTVEDREKRQKFESLRRKEEKLLANADESESTGIVWVKYSLYGFNLPRHNLWRLRDGNEQFRVNGQGSLGLV
ncbi:unnamed protein product [Meloidogyne enterolobii]|uniref:Uncharacterized protein n=1 Tax=Meloidogyne enterolobii TaxID=390850 RepID=A0ACB0Z048_MELEN